MAPLTDGEFTELYREHYAAVLRFVRRRARPDAVDDVVAETFVAAWQRQDEFRRYPLPWLYRTARNMMLNAARSENRRTALAVRVRGEFDDADPTDVAGTVGFRRDLVSAWHRLTGSEQEVLALAIWEQLPGAEAAVVLGLTRAGYTMRLSRARRRLAAYLDVERADPRATDPPPTTIAAAAPLTSLDRK
ncbi:RNA polymerase sigma factor [Curtobacterium sp. ISL-83]|uniref:RNA polymerase sigma factor n=1 Tax=Curtobacterium sp. ISL-83 TaxID=2819145 RepID=UPI001BE97E20|nr:RNA polymerase sigma factor [Curtobacterium sp. ISL-83]MBT2503885.1 RNA polymerase sigma factor [Curtobacterium sp. ISL-83]